MESIKCPGCGKNISNEVNFCPHCGYPLAKKKKEIDLQNEAVTNNSGQPENRRMIDIWKCPDCGMEMREEKDSCPNCACPSSFFEHKQVEDNLSTRQNVRDTMNVSETKNSSDPKSWLFIFVLLAVIVVIGGIVGVAVVDKKEKERAAQEEMYRRRAEEQKRQEEEQRRREEEEKSRLEARKKELSNMVSGNSYSNVSNSLISRDERDKFVYSFSRDGSGSWGYYIVTIFGSRLKDMGTISWWINDDEVLVLKNNYGDYDRFYVHSSYLEGVYTGYIFNKK